MLRTSSYTIFVDLPGDDRETLLVHGYTGAYDKVSGKVAAYLRSLEVGPRAQPLYGEWGPEPPGDGAVSAPSGEVRARLKRRGYLTSLTPPEEENLFARWVGKLHHRASRQQPSYVFMPTYDCNLRCSYCYQDHMRTECGFKHLLRTMRPAIVDRIFAALPELEERHGVDPGGGMRRSIGFFGGEPLLAATRPVVDLIIERAKALGDSTFWAVTNGTELEAYDDLLGPGGLERLQITLDGPPAEHDRRRVYPDGKGSFEKIAGNVARALERGAEVTLRLNVDRGNLDDLPGVAEEISRRGWGRSPGFSAYLAPVRPANDKTDRRTTLSSWELNRRFTEMRREQPLLAVLGLLDDGLRNQARQIFEPGSRRTPRMRPSFCAAHDRMYIFDPFGDVYSCWERTGDPKVRIGRVTPAGRVELFGEELSRWRSRTVASNPVCRRCRYALYCGGGCALLALAERGKLKSNYCDGFQSRFRASVAEAFRGHLARTEAPAAANRLCGR